jgi:hypothetical protein
MRSAACARCVACSSAFTTASAADHKHSDKQMTSKVTDNIN